MIEKLYKEFNFADTDGTCSSSPRIIMTTLSAGDMKFRHDEVNPVRQRFFSVVGINAERIRSLELLHTRTVLVTASSESPEDLHKRAQMAGGADGLVTQDPACILGLTVADCMPIYLFDSKSKAFGLLHSGWKGTGILHEALNVMSKAFDTAPENVQAVLGPAIGSCCYRVPAERAFQFQNEFGTESIIEKLNTEGGPEYFLDLLAANRDIAKKLNIRSLTEINECTCCSPDFGSFRRQTMQSAAGQGHFSRNLALIGYFP